MQLRHSLPCVALALALPPLARPAQDPTGEPPVAGTGTIEAGRPPLEISIDDALRLALTNSLDLKLDEIATDVARYDARGAWGAFEWVFDGTVTYTDAEREGGTTIFGGAVVESESESLDLNLSKLLATGGTLNANLNTATSETTSFISTAPRLTNDVLTLSYVQPLRRGAGREYTTSQQREAELAWYRQREIQRQGRLDMTFRVRNAYWDLVSAIELRGVADSALELGVEQLEQNRRRLDAGVGTEVEVLQAEAEVASRIETLLQAQNTVDQRMDDLRMQIFASKDEDLWDLEVQPVTPLPRPEELDLGELPTWSEALLVALELRSELRQQRTEIDLARLRHRRALSERLSGVELQLTASSGAVDEERSDAFVDTAAWEFPTFTAALSYNMPIGNKSADNAERAARASVRSALVTYDSVELTVLAEVRQAVRDVAFQAEAVRAALTSRDLAERQLEAEEARYQEGLATNFQVLEFQQSLIEALSSESTARADFAKALVALENAQGLLDEESRQ